MGIKPKISVAMCTYNGEIYLKEQLESIRDQTFSPFELVVCDDASTDSTLDILYGFKESCHFHVEIIANRNNVGVNRNYENAITNCSGELIAFADQDDIWMPTKIEEIIDSFQSNPDCGYVFSDAELMDRDGELLGKNLWGSIKFNQKRYKDYISGDQLSVMLKGGNFIYGMTMAFRSKFKHVLLPIDSPSFTVCTHDVWISLILSLIGAYGVPIRKPLVMYRQHENQIAGGTRNFKIREFLSRLYLCNSRVNVDLAEALGNIYFRVQGASLKNEYSLYKGEYLVEKVSHLRARALASESRGIKKYRIVIHELISGRYNKYSKSYKSMFKDIFCLERKLG